MEVERIAQDVYGLDVIFTLHDAIYIKGPDTHPEALASKLSQAMDSAFRFYFSEDLQKRATCRLDIDCWGPTMEESKGTIKFDDEFGREHEAPIKYQTVYIDERSVDDYEKFKQYLYPMEGLEEYEF